MRVLILTGRFGMGHIAAAQALQQEILREDPTTDVTVLDVIETCLLQLRHLIYGCFDFTVNYCSGVCSQPCCWPLSPRSHAAGDDPEGDTTSSGTPI